MNKLINPYPKNIWVLQFKNYDFHEKPNVVYQSSDDRLNVDANPQALLAMMQAIHAISSKLADQIIQEIARMKAIMGENEKQEELIQKWMEILKKFADQVIKQDPPPSQETK